MISSTEEKLTLYPKPGFVIKTRLEASTSSPPRAALTKVFINVVSSPHIPLPQHHSDTFQPEIVYPLIVNNNWEVPIVTSAERRDTDNKGIAALVYDCFVHDRCMGWVVVHRELRQIVAEWCLESVEVRYGVSLDRDVVKFPKLSYKGKEMVPLEMLKGDIEGMSFQRQKQEMERVAREQDHLLMLDAVEDARQGDPGEGEVGEGISIFGGGKGVLKKPLVVEIDSVEEEHFSKKKANSVRLSNAPKSLLNGRSTPSSTNPSVPLSYELKFTNLKDKSQGYQLLVTIKPTIKPSPSSSFLLEQTLAITADDFNLKYDSVRQSLLLRSVNERYVTKDKAFEVPVPLYVAETVATKGEEERFRVFFVNEKKELNVFI